MRPRVRLPAGPLRRFQLPRVGPSARDARPRARARAWAIVPFSLFAALTFWLGMRRPTPDVRHWFDGPPRADTAAAEPPRLAPSLVVPAPAEADAGTSDAGATSPASEAEALPKAKPRRKPPLVLQRHRLRPVLEWDDPARPNMVRPKPARRDSARSP